MTVVAILTGMVLIAVAALGVYLEKKFNKPIRMAASRGQQAIQVLEDIRRFKILYSRHPKFALIQHRITRVLYPQES